MPLFEMDLGTSKASSSWHSLAWEWGCYSITWQIKIPLVPAWIHEYRSFPASSLPPTNQAASSYCDYFRAPTTPTKTWWRPYWRQCVPTDDTGQSMNYPGFGINDSVRHGHTTQTELSATYWMETSLWGKKLYMSIEWVGWFVFLTCDTQQSQICGHGEGASKRWLNPLIWPIDSGGEHIWMGLLPWARPKTNKQFIYDNWRRKGGSHTMPLKMECLATIQAKEMAGTWLTVKRCV